MTGLPNPAQRPLLTIDEARHALGDPSGRSAFYESVRRGEIPGARRVGRRLYLATADLRAWVGLNGNGRERAP